MLLGVYFAKQEGKISLLLISPNLVWLTWEKFPSFMSGKNFPRVSQSKFGLSSYCGKNFP